MDSDDRGGNDIVRLAIRDKMSLYSHYMPFVEGGALFVPTQGVYQLGDKLSFELSVYLCAKPLLIVGVVIWVANCSINSTGQSGVGVQFTRQQSDLRGQIEQALTGMLWSDHPTLTM